MIRFLARVIHYNKLSESGGVYYYRLKVFHVNLEEELILALLFSSKGVVSTRQLYNAFYHSKLEDHTIREEIRSSLDSLELKIRDTLGTENSIYTKAPDVKDRRSHIYYFNKDHFAV
jgi:hypothetical protein